MLKKTKITGRLFDYRFIKNQDRPDIFFVLFLAISDGFLKKSKDIAGSRKVV